MSQDPVRVPVYLFPDNQTLVACDPSEEIIGVIIQ
jgi:hypothetical protein